MPTYEFRCPEGHEFEKFYRTISGAESVAACPQCGQNAERMMSAAGFAFKGSGFYLTDYGKNAHRGTAESGGSPPTKESGADASKGESSGSGSDASKSESSGADSAAAKSSDSAGEIGRAHV